MNPIPGGAEPLTGTVKNDTDVGQIDSISIVSHARFSVDEIRIGQSFADVVPPLTNLIFVIAPQSQTVAAGSGVTFSVSLAGAPPVSYQWQFNGGNLVAATNSSLILTNVQLADAGAYQVVVTNAFDNVTSSPAALAVVPMLIITQPEDALVWPGSNVTCEVAASGAGPITCQWQHNGSDIADATGVSLTFASVQSADEGDYTAVLVNSFGSVTSAPARLLLLVKPAITQDPLSQTVRLGEPLTLTVTASGTPPLWYRWRKNAATYLWPGEASLMIPSLDLTDAGFYDVAVTNLPNALRGGYALSRSAYVTVVDPPVSQAVPLGTNVILRAVVSEPKTFTNFFAWHFNGSTLLQGTNKSTSTLTRFTNALVLTGFDAGQAGTYTYLITNTSGAAAVFTASLTLLDTNPPADVSLSIELQPTNAVVSWTELSTAWTLEQSTNLGATADWRLCPATPLIEGGRCKANVPLAERTQQFFRLRRP